MPLWLFKKKRQEEEDHDHIANQIFHENLKLSFLRIKSDIQTIRDWLDYFKNKDSETSNKVKELDQKIEGLTDVLDYLQSSQEGLRQEVLKRLASVEIKLNSKDLYYSEDKEPLNPKSNRLTETQQALFTKISLLLKEMDQEWLSFRLLAQEAYPNKEYKQIRSTLSEYVNILIENNLLKSQRRGKMTYLSLTTKGKDLLKDTKKSITEEIKKKKSKEE